MVINPIKSSPLYQQTADSPKNHPIKKGTKIILKNKNSMTLWVQKKNTLHFFPNSSSPPPASGLQKAAIE